jgi:hypothetical protein
VVQLVNHLLQQYGIQLYQFSWNKGSLAQVEPHCSKRKNRCWKEKLRHRKCCTCTYFTWLTVVLRNMCVWPLGRYTEVLGPFHRMSVQNLKHQCLSRALRGQFNCCNLSHPAPQVWGGLLPGRLVRHGAEAGRLPTGAAFLLAEL